MKFIMVAYLAASSAFSDHEYEYIRIINLQQKPIIEGTLNGKRAYFLLDTGSDFTLLNEGMSQRYGFSALEGQLGESAHKALGVGGKIVSFRSVHNAAIVLGSTQLSTNCRTYDMSRLVDVIRKKSGVEIVGIIGSDAMKRHGVIIDYGNREVGVILRRKPDRLPLKPLPTSQTIFLRK
ncbi:MAG TPA: retropepsin-like aspartic protease [Cyclobacteriaceae bacterium]|nr:retropepsin-like aspartic protease [Cyclobacteriaceae bacterium]